ADGARHGCGTALRGIRLRKGGHGFLHRGRTKLKGFQAAEDNLGGRIELWVGHGDGFEMPRGEAVSFCVSLRKYDGGIERGIHFETCFQRSMAGNFELRTNQGSGSNEGRRESFPG